VPSYAAIFAQYFTFGGVVTLLPLHVERLGMGPLEVGVLLAAFLGVVRHHPASERGHLRSSGTAGADSRRTGLRHRLADVHCPSLSGFPYLCRGNGHIRCRLRLGVSLHLSPDRRPYEVQRSEAWPPACSTPCSPPGVAIGAPVMGWLGGLTGTGTGLLITPVPVLLALVIALAFLKRA
jgi:hypothetical protein